MKRATLPLSLSLSLHGPGVSLGSFSRPIIAAGKNNLEAQNVKEKNWQRADGN
jgi:hypothetical protein